MAELGRQDGAAIEVRGLTKSYGGVRAVSLWDAIFAQQQAMPPLASSSGTAQTRYAEYVPNQTAASAKPAHLPR
jgi:hypothetical protein